MRGQWSVVRETLVRVDFPFESHHVSSVRELVPRFAADLGGLKSVRENSCRPYGTRSIFPPFPALKRWAIIGCPSGA
jgi:hypothetical protein